MLTLLARLLHILNSEGSPQQISWGIIFALYVGFLPTWNIVGFMVLFLILMLRVNLTSFLFAWGIFELFALAFAGLFHEVGENLLSHPSLFPLWESAYQITIIRLSDFNHTISLGALTISLLLSILFALLLPPAIRNYRKSIQSFIEQFKVIQSLKASKLFQLYQKYQGDH